MLRDRRSLAVMFGIPLLLYPLVAIGVATLAGSKKKELTDQTAKIVINDPGSVPHLIHLMNDQYTGLTAVRLSDPARYRRMLEVTGGELVLHSPAQPGVRPIPVSRVRKVRLRVT